MIHDEVGVPEEAVDAVIKVNTDIVLVLLKAEMSEVEVFEPVIVQLVGDCALCKYDEYQVLGFDDLAELKPG